MNVRTLDIILPLLMELIGAGIIAGVCHWTPEVSVILIGKEMEQVKLRESPAIIGEGGDDVREIFAGSAHYKKTL